jgi:hypothetical protein
MKIPTLQNSSTQRIWLVNQPPTLLRQHGQVKQMQVSEAHSSINFWTCISSSQRCQRIRLLCAEPPHHGLGQSGQARLAWC